MTGEAAIRLHAGQIVIDQVAPGHAAIDVIVLGAGNATSALAGDKGNGRPGTALVLIQGPVQIEPDHVDL